MRVEQRTAEGPPLATIFGIVGLLAAALGAAWVGMGFPRLVCGFREFTGLPCPTCGTTRMGDALLRGDLVGAFTWNPVVFLALSAMGIWAAVSTVRWLSGAPTLKFVPDHAERVALRVGSVALVTGGWIYLIATGA